VAICIATSAAGPPVGLDRTSNPSEADAHAQRGGALRTAEGAAEGHRRASADALLQADRDRLLAGVLADGEAQPALSVLDRGRAGGHADHCGIECADAADARVLGVEPAVHAGTESIEVLGETGQLS